MTANAAASPSKRARTTSLESVARGFHALFTSEPALLETIVGFVPIAVEETEDNDNEDQEEDEEEDEDDEDDDEPEEEGAEMHTRFTVDHALAVIGALCRAFPLLGNQLGPKNKSFWRALVLQRFDFTENGQTFNVEDHDDARWGRGPDQDADPIRLAINEYKATRQDHGGEPLMLANDLEFWQSIGAYFRPADYAFLGQIQNGSAAITTWPEDEDPYTLYRDLSLLQHKLSKFEELETYSDGGQSVFPCFLRRMDSQQTDGGYELLQLCDFVPLYWDGFIHNRWSGFEMPLPPREKKVVDDMDDRRTREEASIFPTTEDYFRCFEGLRRVVHESCDDWRRVHANSTVGEYASAEFYIGRSKLSGRWLGFVGQSDHLAYTTAYRGDEKL